MQETRPAVTELSVTMEDKNVFPDSATISQLYKFYGVKSIGALIVDMSYHIENLQKQLATKDSFTRTYGVRYA